MATFVTHGLIGAAARGGVVKLAGADDTAVIVCCVIGAIEGMAPDAFDWIAAQFGWAPRWQLYTWFHRDAPWEWGLLFWGWGLHRLFDIPFHRTPGEAWWPRLWWLELLGGLVSLAVLWWIFQ